MFNDEIEARAVEIAEYVILTGATVRAASKHFGVSKSTVHTAVTLSNGSCGWWRRNTNVHIKYFQLGCSIELFL